MFVILIIIPLFLGFFNTHEAHAAAFLEPETRVLFQLEEEDVVSVKGQGSGSYEIRDPEASAQDRFLIEIHAEPLETVLERLWFQSLSSEQLRNREINGKTAIEAVGKNHETGDLGKLIVFSHVGKSIAIQYFGADSDRFEAFIAGISFPLAPFSDTIEHEFEQEIATLAEKKIMKGYLARDLLSYEFRPEKPITRAEFLKIVTLSIPGLSEEKVFELCHSERDESSRRAEESLRGVLGKAIPPCALMTGLSRNDTTRFLDTKPNDWFSLFVQFGVELGWVRGYTDGTFRPHATITVAEALKLLITSRDIFVEPAASDEQWYQPYLDVMINLKIIGKGFLHSPNPGNSSLGRNDTPSSPLTRSQAAALIVRLSNALKTEK